MKPGNYLIAFSNKLLKVFLKNDSPLIEGKTNGFKVKVKVKKLSPPIRSFFYAS